MLVYLVRHGDADNSEPDNVRSLTEKGRTITRAMAALLRRAKFEPPELIVSSPLPRAFQTADILSEEFAPNARREFSKALLSGCDPIEALSLIASKKDESKVLMLVGHDPLLSYLASVLLAGSENPVIELQKSAVAKFELTRFDVPRMRGVLRAYLPPGIA